MAYIRWGSSIPSQAEIWTINSDGTNKKRLTNGNYDTYPAWSPNGTKIIFSRRDNSNNYQLYVMNSDGSDLTLITKNIGRYPIWR